MFDFWKWYTAVLIMLALLAQFISAELAQPQPVDETKSYSTITTPMPPEPTTEVQPYP